MKPTGIGTPNTNVLATSKYTHKIAKKNLKKGDILDSPAHVVLFQKWANKAHTKTRFTATSDMATQLYRYPVGWSCQSRVRGVSGPVPMLVA